MNKLVWIIFLLIMVGGISYAITHQPQIISAQSKGAQLGDLANVQYTIWLQDGKVYSTTNSTLAKQNNLSIVYHDTFSYLVGQSELYPLDDVIIGMNENEDKVLWLYPNPASDMANIDVNVANQESDVEINVFDLSGKIVEKVYAGKLETGAHKFSCNTNKLNKGIYLIMLREDNKMYQKRLTVI